MKKKALALLSGGLDSMLAVRVIQEQGIDVEGLNFFTGFCVEGHTHAIRNNTKPKRNHALWVAEQLGIKLHFMDVVEEYKSVLLSPRHGYGKNINPCLDCKIFMVRKAKTWMDEHGFDFLITGEVVGQRPNSQLKHKLPLVAQQSGADDYLLRPLCAKILPPTRPEREAWVDRERLYAFSGRSRKPQMALAKQFGFSQYAQPAGGCCFLTDAHYAAKLQDLWQARHQRDYSLDDIMLLKVGRHLRPSPNFKLIISREEGESHFMEGYRKQFTHLYPTSCYGPLVLVDGQPADHEWAQAARITARFSQGRNAEQVTVALQHRDGLLETLQVIPLAPEQILSSWYV